MPSRGTIYSRFLWGDLSIHIFLMKKKRKREKEKKVNRIGGLSSLVPRQKNVFLLVTKGGHYLPPWALFAVQPGLCLGNRRESYGTTQGNLVIPGFLSRLLGGKTQ